MNAYRRVVASALVILGIAGSGAHAAVLTADADTYLRDGSGRNTAHGGDPFLRVERFDGVDPERLFRMAAVRFDVGGLPTLREATLHLTQYSDGAHEVEVFGLADGLDGWDEARLTMADVDAAGGPGGLAMTSLGTVQLTGGGAGGVLSLTGPALLSFLEGAGADRLVTFVLISAQPANRTGARFYSRDNAAGLDGPLLEVVPMPLPPAAALFAPVAWVFIRRRGLSRA